MQAFPLTLASSTKGNFNRDSHRRVNRKKDLIQTFKGTYNLVAYQDSYRTRHSPVSHATHNNWLRAILLVINRINKTYIIPLINQGDTTRTPNNRGKIPTDKMIPMPNKATLPIPMRNKAILTAPLPNKGIPKIPMANNQHNKTLTPNKGIPKIPMGNNQRSRTLTPNKAIPTTPMLSRVILATPRPNKGIPKIPMGNNQHNRTLTPNKAIPTTLMLSRAIPTTPMPNKATPTTPMLSRVILATPRPNKGIPKIPMGNKQRSPTPTPNKAIPTTPMLSRAIPTTPMPNKATPTTPMLSRAILTAPLPQQGYPQDPYGQQTTQPDPYAQQGYPNNPNAQQGYPSDPSAQQGYPQSPNTPTGYQTAGGTIGTPIGLDVVMLKQTIRNGAAVMVPIQDGNVLKDGRGDAKAGDKFRIMLRPHTDGFVYVVAIDGSGWAQGIFPPPTSPLANPVKAGEQYVLPEGNNWFSLDQFKGIETIFFVASQEKRQDLEEILQSITGRERPASETPQQVTKVAMVPYGVGGARQSAKPFSLSGGSGQDQTIMPTSYFSKTAGEDLRLTRWFRHE